MTNVKILTFEGETKPQLYACGKCGSVHSPNIYAATEERRHEAARQAAEECCAPRHCKGCGCEVEKYRTMCRSCSDAKRLEKAVLTDYADCEDVIWSDVGSGDMGEGYYHDMQSYLDFCADDGIKPAEYVFATTTAHIHLDIDNVLENACSDLYEDAIEDVVGYDELLTAINTFNAAQTAVGYWMDVSRKIKVPKQEGAE